MKTIRMKESAPIQTLKAKSPSGKVYIGDPCYVMKNDLYDLLFAKMDWDGVHCVETEVLPGVIACAGTTRYGDGFYDSFPVDSGTLGAVPIEACDPDKISEEHMFQDGEEVTLNYNPSTGGFAFHCQEDYIVVDTDGDDEDLDESSKANRGASIKETRVDTREEDDYARVEHRILDIIDGIQDGAYPEYKNSTVKEIWGEIFLEGTWAKFCAYLKAKNSPLLDNVLDEDFPKEEDLSKYFEKIADRIEDIICGDDPESGKYNQKYAEYTVKEIWEDIGRKALWPQFYAWLDSTNNPLTENVREEDVPLKEGTKKAGKRVKESGELTKNTIDKLAEALILVSEGLGIMGDDLCEVADCDHEVMAKFNDSEVGKALNEVWQMDFETNAMGDLLGLLYSKAGLKPSKAASDHFML